MALEGIKEKLEYKKIKLKILRNNLELLKNDNEFKNKFYINEENIGGVKSYDISQSKYSLSLIFSALKYPDAKTCFFVELFNFYQSLDGNVLYRSFSQSLTTYILKELARNHLIDFSLDRRKYNVSLKEYGDILGNNNLEKSKKMYIVYFYKLSSLKEKDLPLIKSIANILGIDFNNINITYEKGKMRLSLKKTIILKQVLSLAYLKKLSSQKNQIKAIIKEAKDYIFEDFNDYERYLRL